MLGRKLLSTSLLFAASFIASTSLLANATKYNVEASVSRDGKTVAEPKLVIEAGKEAAVDVGDSKLKIVASEADGATVPTAITFELKQKDGNTTSSKTSLKLKLGDPMTFGLETDSGADIEITMKLTKG